MKIWTDLSSVLSQCTRVTDGRTDGQTDRILIAIPRLHYMQRGKKKKTTTVARPIYIQCARVYDIHRPE